MQVYLSDDDFKAYKQGRFLANYTKIKERFKQEGKAIKFDEESLIGERRLSPIQNITMKAKTKYRLSEAEKQLEQTVKTPLQLKEIVLPLQPFSLKQIASHQNPEAPY